MYLEMQTRNPLKLSKSFAFLTLMDEQWLKNLWHFAKSKNYFSALLLILAHQFSHMKLLKLEILVHGSTTALLARQNLITRHD